MTFTIRNNVQQDDYEPGECITEQHHAKSHEIDFIIDQYTRTGVIQHNSQYEGRYGEMPSADAYEAMHNAVAEAQTFFEELPQEIRADFREGTPQFLEFISNPNNRDKIEAYGLDTSHLPEVEAQPAPTPATPGAAAAPPENVLDPQTIAEKLTE